MLELSGGAPITCCWPWAVPQHAMQEIQTYIASLMWPVMFFHPNYQSPICVGWFDDNIIAKRARIALA
jgi:hypothetical protein